MKKKLGAAAGSWSSTSARMLAWISATADNVDRPSPSETSIRPVDAPGRCRFAIPSRAQAARGAGACRDNTVSATPPSQNSPSVATAAPQNQAANFRSGDVATTSPARIAASATFIATSAPRCRSRVGSSASRNSAAPEICAARASGHSANAPAVSSP